MILVWKPEGKRPLVRPHRRWEDAIKMDIQKYVWSSWMALICLRMGMCGWLLWRR